MIVHVQAAVALATGETFDQHTGWVGLGFEPVTTNTIGSGAFAQAGCGQGFFWALAYKVRDASTLNHGHPCPSF